MIRRPSRRAILLGIAATSALVALLVGACTLNPQPLPPEAFSGESDASSKADAGARSDGTGAGGFNDADSSPPPGPQDGGDAATDASVDAPLDAPSDGAITDADDGGGG
jgi:hypothetical protein